MTLERVDVATDAIDSARLAGRHTTDRGMGSKSWFGLVWFGLVSVRFFHANFLDFVFTRSELNRHNAHAWRRRKMTERRRHRRGGGGNGWTVSPGCFLAFVAFVARDAMRWSTGDDVVVVDASSFDLGGSRMMEWVEGAFWTYGAATVGTRIGEIVLGDVGATVMSCVCVAVVHGKAFACVACGFVVCFARLVKATREAPFSIARKRAVVFLVVIVTFVVIDAAETMKCFGGCDGVLSAGTFTRWRASRYDALRLLSFGIDSVADAEDAETPFSIGRCLRYVFYPPCRQVGPVVMYRDFKRRSGVARTWAGKAYAIRELLDCLAWYSMTRVAYATFYHPLNPPSYPNRDGFIDAVVFTWTHATALWAQSAIVYNSAHALCVLDGAFAVRDVSQFWTTSATSFTHFWRHFHVSLHEYFLVYVHRPTRGTWVSVTFAFAFSILFHGASSAQWRGFFAIQTFGVLAERAIRRRFDGDGTRRFFLRDAYQAVLMCLFTAGAVPTVRLDARVFVAYFIALAFVQRLTLDRDAPSSNDVDDDASLRGAVGECGGEPRDEPTRAQTTGARRLSLRLRERRREREREGGG